MPELRLSHEAENDLFATATFGIERFGPIAAERYFNKLIDQLRKIATEPERFPDVRHIRPGYRRCVFGVLSIYFRQGEESVEIVRILGRQSLDGLE